MRAFLALLPDPDTAIKIDWWRSQCWRDVPGAVAVQNLHITLAFLGDIDASQQRRLQSLLDGVVRPAFSIELATVGYQLDQRMLWLEPGAHAECRRALDELVVALRQTCARAGIGVDKGRYRPHMTLARRLATPAPSPLFAPNVVIEADRFHLVASRRNPDGPVYQIVQSWQLGY